MRFQICCSGLLLTAVAGLLFNSAGIRVSPAEQVTSDEAKQQRSGALLKMRECARGTNVFLLADEKATPIDMLEEPIMRYADPPRGTLDATLWLFTPGGRPTALLKVESRDGRWITGVTSLSDDLIETRWDERQVFRSTKPGITMHGIPDAPQPAENSTARLRQIKQLSRRFSAKFTNRSGAEEMRLLPRPVHRYSDSESELKDAAIFALTSTGTNPNALLVLELHQSPSEHQWRYGVARLTVGALNVRLDDKTVWEAPYISRRRPTLDDTYGTAIIKKDEEPTSDEREQREASR